MPTLDDFIALNDQLAAAIEAGVPMAIDLDSVDVHPTQALERINAVVARHVSRGRSLEDAVLGAGPELPPQYRSLVQIWLRSRDSIAVLDRASELGEALQENHEEIRLSFVYPLIVFALALAGMVAFCLFVLPALETFCESMHLSLGSRAGVLNAVARLLPVWGLAGAVLVLVAAWFIWRSAHSRMISRKSGFGARLGGADSANADWRTAAFADWLALLLSSGGPTEEGVRLASEASGDRRLEQAAASLEDMPSIEDAGRTEGFPPFLRWALARPGLDERMQALRVAADVYRDSARRSSARAAVVVPIVASALIGGGAVLLYGLSLFMPLSEMLHSVAAMH